MTETANDWTYDQRVPSDPDVCSKIIGVLLDNLEKYKWTNKDTFGIHMAMEEAVMNAIRHGNKCAPDKEVHVLIEIKKDRFYAKITDQGDGFDPTLLPDPTADNNLEKTSGRGVMLMNNFVEEVVYNDKGNSVELKKKKATKAKK